MPINNANDFAASLSIEPPPRKAENALRQEDDHGDEDDAERDQIGELIAEECANSCRASWKKPAPTIGPTSVPMPPMTL